MKLLLLYLFAFIVAATNDQSLIKKDNLPPSKTLINNNHVFINPQISDTNHVASYHLIIAPLVNEQKSLSDIMSNVRNYYLSSSYLITISASNLQFYHITNLFMLNDNISLLTISNHGNYIYEGSTSFGASLIWQPSQKLTFDLTPNILRYFYGPCQLMSVVKPSISASCRYRLMNWLSLKAFGAYTMGGSNLLTYSLLAPQNAFGAGVVVKVYKGIGIEVGIEEINYNGQWHRNFYSNPTNY